MAYATITDIRAQLPEETLIQLTDDAGTGTADEAQVEEAIAAADSTIDGYAGTRYEVPFVQVPTLIPRICVDIAIYNLFSRRENVPENRTQRYKDAIRLLENISKGIVSVGKIPEPAAPQQKVGEVSSNERIFSRNGMKGY